MFTYNDGHIGHCVSLSFHNFVYAQTKLVCVYNLNTDIFYTHLEFITFIILIYTIQIIKDFPLTDLLWLLQQRGSDRHLSCA